MSVASSITFIAGEFFTAQEIRFLIMVTLEFEGEILGTAARAGPSLGCRRGFKTDVLCTLGTGRRLRRTDVDSHAVVGQG